MFTIMQKTAVYTHRVLGGVLTPHNYATKTLSKLSDNGVMRCVSPSGMVTNHEYQVRDVINSLHGRNVLYLGHIESTKHMHMFKFGISRAMPQRVRTHKKTFGRFDLCFIAEYDRNYAVEKTFSELAKSRGLLMDGFLAKNASGLYKKQREIVAISREFPGITYADIAIDMHNLLELDSAKHIGSHKGQIYVRERLHVY